MRITAAAIPPITRNGSRCAAAWPGGGDRLPAQGQTPSQGGGPPDPPSTLVARQVWRVCHGPCRGCDNSSPTGREGRWPGRSPSGRRA